MKLYQYRGVIRINATISVMAMNKKEAEQKIEQCDFDYDPETICEADPFDLELEKTTRLTAQSKRGDR